MIEKVYTGNFFHSTSTYYRTFSALNVVLGHEFVVWACKQIWMDHVMQTDHF